MTKPNHQRHDPIRGDLERSVQIPHDMARIVESDKPGFLALISPGWWNDEIEYIKISEAPEKMNELLPEQWISMVSQRKAGNGELLEIESFEKIDPPIYTSEERDAFWNQKEIGGRDDIEQDQTHNK